MASESRDLPAIRYVWKSKLVASTLSARSAPESEPGQLYAALWHEHVQHAYLVRTCDQLGIAASKIIPLEVHDWIEDPGCGPGAGLARTPRLHQFRAMFRVVLHGTWFSSCASFVCAKHTIS